MSIKKNISDLDMPLHTQGILLSKGINHLEQLKELTPSDLDKMGISEYGSQGSFHGHHTNIVRALEKEGLGLSRTSSRTAQASTHLARSQPNVTATGLRNLMHPTNG